MANLTTWVLLKLQDRSQHEGEYKLVMEARGSLANEGQKPL